jgi:hypothetical protein
MVTTRRSAELVVPELQHGNEYIIRISEVP